jgi:hypothetical protein
MQRGAPVEAWADSRSSRLSIVDCVSESITGRSCANKKHQAMQLIRTKVASGHANSEVVRFCMLVDGPLRQGVDHRQELHQQERRSADHLRRELSHRVRSRS